jgi:hypothetical protein
MSSWSVTGDCTSLGSPYPSGDYWTFDASTMTVSGGSCPASVIADIPGAFHETRVTPCDGAAAIAGCQNGFSCLPNPAAPFDSALCIWRVGDFACPAGSGYEQRSVYHTDFDDTRDCGVCTCESPAGDCIESWIELTDSPSCSSGTLLGVIFGNGFCVQGSLGPSAQAGAFNPVATGSCTPAGGGVVGSVVPTGPITVCCSTP